MKSTLEFNFMVSYLFKRRIAIAFAIFIALCGGGGIACSAFIDSINTKANESVSDYPNHLINGDFEYYKDTIFSFHDEWVPFDAFPKYINRNDGTLTIGTYCSKSGKHSFSNSNDSDDPINYKSDRFGWYRPNSDAIAIWKDTKSGNAFGLLNKDSELYQDIATESGMKYVWRLDHSSTSNNSTAPSIQVIIENPKTTEQSVQNGPQEAKRVDKNANGTETYTNIGKIITTDVAGKIVRSNNIKKINGTDYVTSFDAELEGSWQTYTGEYTVPEGQNVTRFTFKNVDQQGQPATEAVNVIDNVIFSVLCPIEFFDPIDKKVVKAEEIPAYTKSNGVENVPIHSGYTFKGYTYADGSPVDLSCIDKAGRITLRYEVDPLPISVASNSDGFGSSIISWSEYNYRNLNFKVYQSSDNKQTWNSVGIDYASVESIRCLQIYPHPRAEDQLEEWMETNGYGKGIIHTTSISIEQFNENPIEALKDENGYKYEVVFFGTWDSNNSKDITEDGTEAIRNYIRSGRGVIFGHDTLTDCSPTNDNFISLMEDAALYTPEPCYMPDGNYSIVGMRYSGNSDYPHSAPLNEDLESKVKITKKGLLTNYPWSIGDVDDVLSVPICHNRQASNGTIWLRFADQSYTDSDMQSNENFYLCTYNNTAMIQTGHSNGNATEDEQKIIANLIFYMNQLLFNACSLCDASAQDTASPRINSHTVSCDGNAVVSFDAQDFGTTYSYYVESYSKNDTTQTGKLAESDVEDVTVTTGLLNYYYLFDDKEDTEISDVKLDELTKSGIGNIAYGNHGGEYMHIVAVDGAGNKSDTYTLQLPAPASFTIDVTKQMSDKTSIADGEFSFRLYRANTSDYRVSATASPIATVSCDSSGKATFVVDEKNAIQSPGTFAYAIKEVADSANTNIFYDTHSEIVKIVATDNLDGELSLQFSFDKGSDDDTKGIVFVNSRKGVPLWIEKASMGVTDSFKDTEYSFTFCMNDLHGKQMQDIPYHRYTKDPLIGKQVEIESGMISTGETFNMRAGESYMFIGHEGAQYEFIEDVPNGYAVESYDEKGTIGEYDSYATFINIYSASGFPEQIKTFVKDGSINGIDDGKYEFELLSSSGDHIETCRNDSNGNISFTLPTFTQQDDGKTFEYKIKQKIPQETKGCLYDESELVVTIVPHDNGNGTLSFRTSYAKNGVQSDEPIEFVNRIPLAMPETGMTRSIAAFVFGMVLVVSGCILVFKNGTRAQKRKRRKN